MNRHEVEARVVRVLAEAGGAGLPEGGPGDRPDLVLSALRRALLLEDVFGIVLTDPELDLGVLGDAGAVARLIVGRLAAEAGPGPGEP